MNFLKYDGQRILVFAPHADDEVLGCGGIIQKFIKHDSPVRVVIGTFALGSDKKFRKETKQYEEYSGAVRMDEFINALKILGVQDRRVLYVDSLVVQYQNQLDRIPKCELIGKIEEEINDFNPTILLIPSFTRHQDHAALYEACLAAARPYYWNGSVLVYETDGELKFKPSLYIPLSSDEIEKKLKAISAYKTQLRSSCHPVNPLSQKAKAIFRGQIIYEDYAEAFQIFRLHG